MKHDLLEFANKWMIAKMQSEDTLCNTALESWTFEAEEVWETAIIEMNKMIIEFFSPIKQQTLNQETKQDSNAQKRRKC